MKKIEMVILPSKTNDMKGALRKIGIHEMTVSKVRKCGGQTGYAAYCRGGKYESKYEPAFLAETRIELEVTEEDLGRVLAVIEESAEDAAYGDEKVFIYSLDDTIKLGKKARSTARI